MAAGERHLDAAAQADSVHGCDSRDADFFQGVEDTLSEPGSLRSLGWILETFDRGEVRPRNEPALRAPHYDHVHPALERHLPRLG